MTIEFIPPSGPVEPAAHHRDAAAGNHATTTRAIETLRATLSGDTSYERLLLKAAAGAGKSFALKRMVADALTHPRCGRVGVTAFANKQIIPLARGLGEDLGRERVCLYVSKGVLPTVDPATCDAATVVDSQGAIPPDVEVLLCTSHMFGFTQWGMLERFGPAENGETLFDVLMVDEAWQLPLHRYRKVDRLAPIDVGVGDVGQLPPLDPGQNPWRGDPGYNPYRAWPTEYDNDSATWAEELPAVWRPTAAQLPLWRAFYGDWDSLDCVASPGDRSIELPATSADAADSAAAAIWAQVATGVPTLIEVDGLDEPDAPDIDPPLMAAVEGWLDELLTGGFALHEKVYDTTGEPSGDKMTKLSDPSGDPLIAVLATRNQAVDDATEMVDRLVERHGLADGVIIASTVDSWQGQTNGITVAIHPLSGASALDEFNSAFGRLAVTCTRATHGLLMVSRAGLDELISTARPRPGTPFGEPGTRQLPRQTHERILAAFARATVTG